MRRILASIASVLAVTVLIMGAPAVLLALVGNPLPSWATLSEAMTVPDFGGRFFLGTVLPLIGWGAWAFFTIPFLAAIPTAIRHARRGATPRPAPAAFRMQQAAASALVTAVLVILGASATPASAATGPPAMTSAVPAADLAQPTEVPAASGPEQPVTTKQEFRERTIVHGDTLWDIAAEELGAGQRYPEIFEASTHIEQPGGRRLTDPDLILPGWTVHIPQPRIAPVAPAEPAAPPADEHVAPTLPDSAGQALPGPGIDHPTPTADQEVPDAARTVSEANAGDGDSDIAGVVRTAGGISGLLAAGLLAVLVALRVHQRRRRRTGERLRLPDEQAHHLERQLRDASDESGIADVDRAARTLGAWAASTGTALPALYAIRLDTTGPTFFLADPVRLPAPFESASDDDLVWTYPAAAADRAPGAANPYPSLLLLGQDPVGAHILIDLEHWRTLQVHGDPALVAAALTSMTLELSTAQWSDDLRVTVVGAHHGLALALDTSRVRYLNDTELLLPALRARTMDVRRALTDAGHASIADARLSDSPDSWPTEVVIIHTTLTDAQADTLADIVSHSDQAGIAVIAGQPLLEGAQLRLRDDEHASLEPIGLELHPQHVGDEVLSLLTRLMGDAAAAPRTPEHDAPAVASRPAPVVDDDDPSHPTQTRPPDDEESPPQPSAQPNAPYLRLLGPVGIDLPELEGEPGAPAPGRGVELVAYLHLHPHATTDQLAQAFWPNAAPQAASMSMRKLTNHTRNWLGAIDEDAETGTVENYLPRYDSAQGYRLHTAIRSDWGEFEDLVGPDITAASSERLRAALRLVKGQPFAGIKQRFWAWCHLDLEEMIARISDVADELFGRAYAARDHGRAQFAATVGNVVDPVNETAWRNLMLSALAKGDTDRFERIVGDLERYLDSFDEGYEPEPETQSLIDEGRRELVTDT
jgi:DNA-binding SARP family transcriptional activator